MLDIPTRAESVESSKRKADKIRSVSLLYAFGNPPPAKLPVKRKKRFGSHKYSSPKEQEALAEFWRKLSASDSIFERRQLLAEYSEVVLEHKADSKKRRRLFEKKAKKFMPFSSSSVCRACGSKARARHHIIWVSNGGSNNCKNLIFLCNKCHAELHPWM